MATPSGQLEVRDTQASQFNNRDGIPRLDDPFRSISVAAAMVLCEYDTVVGPTPHEVMKLCDCPAIHLIFRDFTRNCWSRPGNAIRHCDVYAASAMYYESLGAPRPWQRPLGLPTSYPAGNAIHIADFMLRCRDFVVTYTHPEFASRCALDGEGASRLLVALLGVCIVAHERRAFPEGGPPAYDGSSSSSQWAADLDSWHDQHLGWLGEREHAAQAVSERKQQAQLAGRDPEATWLWSLVGAVDGPVECPGCDMARFCDTCRSVAPFHKAGCSQAAGEDCMALLEDLKI
ncbi:hypothetical protein F4809DRAFT_642720 [Biscogniauxia mediterranea]|nr:hypothetical protein F4809DRAFT_642720 [Biscogniauxia mediterranea]